MADWRGTRLDRAGRRRHHRIVHGVNAKDNAGDGPLLKPASPSARPSIAGSLARLDCRTPNRIHDGQHLPSEPKPARWLRPTSPPLHAARSLLSAVRSSTTLPGSRQGHVR